MMTMLPPANTNTPLSSDRSRPRYQTGINWLLHVLRRMREVATQRGFGYVARYCAAFLSRQISAPFSYMWYRRRPSQSFTLAGKSYSYFVHYHNTTWRNERAVEIAVVAEYLRAATGHRILEVGNVLSHYAPVSHDILDKFEVSPQVINKDIVDFAPAHPYDLIVSISTLEHVGWDEQPVDPVKPLRAINHMRELLAPGGCLLVTIPMGYNPHLDELLRDGRLTFSQRFCLCRVDKHAWVECDWEAIATKRYNSPYVGANGLLIGLIRAS